MRMDRKWGYWEEVEDDDKIQGKLDNDHYNGPYRLKPGVENRFNAFLWFIFKCTAINRSFFKDFLLRAIRIHKDTWQEINFGEII